MGIIARMRQPQPQAFTENWLSDRVVDFFNGGPTASGVRIGGDSAMRISTFYACVNVLSQDVGKLPLILYRRLPDGGRERATDHPLYRLLHDRPNHFQTSYRFRQTGQTSLALRGNAYAHVTRYRGEVRELLPINPDRVTVKLEENYRLAYQVDGKPKPAAEMLHVRGLSMNGFTGVSVPHWARESLGLAAATEQHGARLFGNGALFRGILKHPGKMKDDAVAKRMRESFNAMGSGDNAHGTALLEDGVQYERVSMTPEDSQFLECVVAGTLVSMADGSRKRVEDLRPGDKVMGWREGPLVASVAAVGRPPVKPLVRIVTDRGREITTTVDHPFLVKVRLRTKGSRVDSSEPVWVAAKDLQPGGYVRIGMGAPVGAAYQELAPESAYFLGGMVGNGCIRESGFTFSTDSESVIERMRGIVDGLGGELVPISGDAVTYQVNTGGVGRSGSPIRSLLRDAAMIGEKAHTKRVPEIVMRGGPSTWRAFLTGYLDADGSVGPLTKTQQPKAYWSSVNRELLEDCQHLLAALEINSSIFQMSEAGRRLVVGQICDVRTAWGLYVTGAEQLRLLATLLDPSHERRRANMETFADLPPSRYREENWLYDRVKSVELLPPGETVGVEIEGVHTHVTAGIVTHNTREFQAYEIARWFRMPPHKVGLLKEAKYATIEHAALEYVTDTLLSWLINWEQELSATLLTEDERGELFFEHLVDGLLRGDIKSRYQAYKDAILTGFMSRNEARARENLNPADGLDEFLEPLNMTTAGEPREESLNA